MKHQDHTATGCHMSEPSHTVRNTRSPSHHHLPMSFLAPRGYTHKSKTATAHSHPKSPKQNHPKITHCPPTAAPPRRPPPAPHPARGPAARAATPHPAARAPHPGTTPAPRPPGRTRRAPAVGWWLHRLVLSRCRLVSVGWCISERCGQQQRDATIYKTWSKEKATEQGKGKKRASEREQAHRVLRHLHHMACGGTQGGECLTQEHIQRGCRHLWRSHISRSFCCGGLHGGRVCVCAMWFVTPYTVAGQHGMGACNRGV